MADTENSLLHTDGIPEIDYSIEVLNETETGGIPAIEYEMEVMNEMPRETDKSLTIEDCAADAKATGDAISNLAADISDYEGKAPKIVYPIGSIYVSTSSEPPYFPNTYWQEVIPVATVAQIKSGSMDFTPGVGTGTAHYWQRIIQPENGGEGT